LYPVGAGPHVDLVQIDVEDLVLGELLFHAGGENRLFQLAGKLLLRGEEHGFGHLLGDGGSPLLLAHVNDVLDYRPGNSQVVYPLVLVEVGVFRRHKGLDQPSRNLVDLHHLAPLQVEFPHEAAIVAEDLGDDGGTVVGKAVHLGEGDHQVAEIGEKGEKKQTDDSGQKNEYPFAQSGAGRIRKTSVDMLLTLIKLHCVLGPFRENGAYYGRLPAEYKGKAG